MPGLGHRASIIMTEIEGASKCRLELRQLAEISFEGHQFCTQTDFVPPGINKVVVFFKFFIV